MRKDFPFQLNPCMPPCHLCPKGSSLFQMEQALKINNLICCILLSLGTSSNTFGFSNSLLSFYPLQAFYQPPQTTWVYSPSREFSKKEIALLSLCALKQRRFIVDNQNYINYSNNAILGFRDGPSFWWLQPVSILLTELRHYQRVQCPNSGKHSGKVISEAGGVGILEATGSNAEKSSSFFV